MEKEFRSIDEENRWSPLYGEIRFNSPVLSNKVAKNPENKNRNRYRDVSPYDHSRVKLQNVENDYINASLVVVEEAQRNYILTQGPLPNTCCHFWLMVWQQKSKAIVMLNRVVEKDAEKCAQYWPTSEDEVLLFKETGLCVKRLSEDIKANYTVRLLELQNINTSESRKIFHFHYTTWPDFGVPESPAAFLDFLFEVRKSGSLNPEHGPSVVHCSAGIGRSGTFSLVDTCLVLIEKRKDPSTVDIKQVLLDMRRYRMGLIQTPGQLRFSYMAVIEGTKITIGGSNPQNSCNEISKDDQYVKADGKQAEGCNGNRLSTGEQEETNVSFQEAVADAQSTLRKRERDLRKANTAQTVQLMKQKMVEVERKRKRWLFWKPFFIPVGLASAIIAGALICSESSKGFRKRFRSPDFVLVWAIEICNGIYSGEQHQFNKDKSPLGVYT
ncbi:tyrosine-protein phosphatase non-receptor type 2 [Gastrophryne carolinensis]